jgi:hypothetical protein
MDAAVPAPAWFSSSIIAQIHKLAMIELAAAIRARELSPVAVADHYLRRTRESRR